ncbi:MAG: sigma-54 dependent transcriptional regulator, partial [Chlamydiota bacterium]
MTLEKILVVDDEELLRDFVAETLKRQYLDVTTAEDGTKALRLIKENTYDLVFTDMKMPDMTGLDLMQQAKEISPNSLFVIVTGFASIENAVDAMRFGAFNYLVKPFSPDTIEAVVEKAREHRQLVQENHYLREQVSQQTAAVGKDFIAESPAMKMILQDVQTVAQSNANVFITGESGVGKEVIASAIHSHSQRTDRPFIKVNCAAIPETLVESEFFGHEKGAFTGAHARRNGRFELANTGTLLLDEITEVPIMLQAKLLRVIQEQEFERIGGSKPIKVDVRIVSTSNRNISQAIEEKVLREDLYYRLNVVPIQVPPLRGRVEDIIPLAKFFVEKFCIESHFKTKVLAKNAEDKLLHYHWPGNVRELANIIERAVVMCPHEKIPAEAIMIDSLTKATPPDRRCNGCGVPVGTTLKELEKRLIIETLEAQNQNRTKAAEMLDISV